MIFIWYLADAVMHGTGYCLDKDLASSLAHGKAFFGDGAYYGDGRGSFVGASQYLNKNLYGIGNDFGYGYGYGDGYDNGSRAILF